MKYVIIKLTIVFQKEKSRKAPKERVTVSTEIDHDIGDPTPDPAPSASHFDHSYSTPSPTKLKRKLDDALEKVNSCQKKTEVSATKNKAVEEKSRLFEKCCEGNN